MAAVAMAMAGVHNYKEHDHSEPKPVFSQPVHSPLPSLFLGGGGLQMPMMAAARVLPLTGDGGVSIRVFLEQALASIRAEEEHPLRVFNPPRRIFGVNSHSTDLISDFHCVLPSFRVHFVQLTASG
jgi:hypothetical protein